MITLNVSDLWIFPTLMHFTNYMPGKECIRDQLKTKSQTLQEDFSWGSEKPEPNITINLP